MKRQRKQHIFIMTIVCVVIHLAAAGSSQSRPMFYLATDKSFGKNEIPYINLEGPGDTKYEFRVYNIDDPVTFITRSVKERLVKQQKSSAYGNPVAIFKNTLINFKRDYRKVARRELNYRTRVHLKRSVGIDYNKPDSRKNPAVPGLLTEHSYLFSFVIPAGKSGWMYKRVPVPVSKNGMYLVEAVNGSNLSYTLVVKSNINFVTKQSDKQTLIYAARRDTGNAIGDAKVMLFDGSNAREIFTGKTGKEGIVEVRERVLDKTLILVSTNGEYALSDPNFYSKSFYGTGGYRAFLYTERPIYKPGDEVFFKGIIRNFKNDRYSRASGSGSAYVIDTEGKRILDNIRVGLGGSAATLDGTFKLPDNITNLGVYNLVVDYNNESFSTEFSVEAYKKPEYKVKVATSKKTYIGSEKIPVTVSARYYYGDPVSSGKVHYRVFRRKKYDYSPVGQLPFYELDPAYLGMDGSNAKRDLVLDKHEDLDSSGTVSFSITPSDVDDDYTYVVIASVSALNSTLSGAASFSVNRSAFYIKILKESTVYSPGEDVTVKTQLKPFDSTLTNKQINKIVSSRQIEAVLYSRSFKNISRESVREKIDTKTVVTDRQGNAAFTFKVPQKGHYILVCSAKDPAGEKTSAQTTFWSSAKSDSIQIPFKNITLKSKKDIYQVGEYAEVLMMTPAADGTLFVTLEGNRIIKYDAIRIKGNSYRYQVKITEEMSPNFTISVLQFAANDVFQNQVKVVAPPLKKFINVTLKTAKKTYKPGESATLAIQTTDFKNRGLAAEVSVAVVDEAVFQLQEDKNPPVSTYFYHPRRNNVNTTLSTAYRFFGYSEARRLQLALARKMNTPLSAIKDEDQSRENYKDTCFWQAKVTTNRSGKATITFPLAENITTWRVTAIAVTPDTRVGQGKTRFLARKKLMVFPGTPGYFLKGEKQQIAANVTNTTKKELKTVVSIKTKDIDVTGNTSQTITIKPRETKQVYFTVVPDKNSSVNECVVELRAKSGALFDGAKQTIPLEQYGIKRTASSYARLEDDDSKKLKVTLPGKFLEPRLEIRLSPGTGEALRQSLAYLVDYPYGCIEQTMSRFMPLLAAKRAGYIGPNVNRKLASMVRQGLASIKGHQRPDGGFGWYGDTQGDPLMTAYVYRGLVVCKKLYGQTDARMMVETRKYLYKYISQSDPAPFERAYILAALSEGGKIEQSMLNKLVNTAGDQTAYGKALISLTLHNSQKQQQAVKMYKDALDQSDFEGESDKVLSSQGTVWSKDNVETIAALLTVAVRLGQDKKDISSLASLLLVNRRGIAWKNSRDTAMAVLALSEQLEKIRESGDAAAVTVKLNGTTLRQFSVTPGEIEKDNAVLVVSGQRIKQNNTIEIAKEGGVALYATALVHYVDTSAHFDPEDKGYELKRNYYKMSGEQNSDGTYDFSAGNTSSFKQGDLVMVELDVNMKGTGKTYNMIEDPVPPGFSVVRKDSEYYSTERAKEYSTLQIFYDKAVCFVPNTYRQKNQYTLRYFLRANIPGTYNVLPAKASMMYYPEVYGTSADKQLIIEK